MSLLKLKRPTRQKKGRALALAIVTSGVGLGAIIMAPAASLLIERFDWRTSFLVMSFIALLFVPFSFLFKRTPAEIKDIAIKKEGLAEAGKFGQENQHPDGFSITQAIKTRNFRLLIVTWFFFFLCVHSSHSFSKACD